jgi:hypothetical protein
MEHLFNLNTTQTGRYCPTEKYFVWQHTKQEQFRGSGKSRSLATNQLNKKPVKCNFSHKTLQNKSLSIYSRSS